MNVIDNIIETHTKYSPLDFTGGNIQVSVSKYTKSLAIKLVLYFGYNATRNSITESFDIDENDIERFSTDLIERAKMYLEVLKNKDTRKLSYECLTNDVRGTPNGSGTKVEKVKKVEVEISSVGLSPSTPMPTKSEFMKTWNENASSLGIQTLRNMSDKRYKKLKQRINHNPDFLNDLAECFGKAVGSRFIQEGNWFSYDWLVANDDNYIKVLEGNYDNK